MPPITWINTERICRVFPEINSSWARFYCNRNSQQQNSQFRNFDNGFANATLIDRAEPSKSTFGDFFIDSPMPELDKKIPTWDQLSYERTQQIENIASTVDGVVLPWSGGIDSTYIVSCILKHSSKEFINNVTLVLTQESIYENPYFYKNVILKNFKNINNAKLYDFSSAAKSNLIISGDCGDRIMGSDSGIQWMSEYPKFKKDHYAAHRRELVDYVNRWFNNYQTSNELYEYVDSQIQRLNINAITVFDFFWWVDFNLTWQHMKHHALTSAVIDSACADSFYKNYLLWFDTTGYQQWSLANIEEKYCYSSKIEKYHAKKFIHELDHNDYYLNFKTKLQSEINFFRIKNLNQWTLAIGADRTVYTTTDVDLRKDAAAIGLFQNI